MSDIFITKKGIILREWGHSIDKLSFWDLIMLILQIKDSRDFGRKENKK
jgi:hypothetical protein